MRDRELCALSQLFRCPKCSAELNAKLHCTNTKCGEEYKHLLPKAKNLDYCRCLHAEENAILQVSRLGGMGLRRGIMFVTAFPCALCAKKIAACGIETVFFAEPYNMPEALEVLRDAKVEVRAFEGFTHNAFGRVYRQTL